MAFSHINTVGICSTVSCTGVNISTAAPLGQLPGVSCVTNPVISGGPHETIGDACSDLLSPPNSVKFSNNSTAGNVIVTSELTNGEVGCGVDGAIMEEGVYIFYGKFGVGYPGYQIVTMDGRINCRPKIITDSCDP